MLAPGPCGSRASRVVGPAQKGPLAPPPPSCSAPFFSSIHRPCFCHRQFHPLSIRRTIHTKKNLHNGRHQDLYRLHNGPRQHCCNQVPALSAPQLPGLIATTITNRPTPRLDTGVSGTRLSIFQRTPPFPSPSPKKTSARTPPQHARPRSPPTRST